VPDTVRELIGVYDADGTVLGEARYWIGARLGRTHCALCEITHGLFTERADWRRCRDQLDVEFRTYHRNDAPEDVLAVWWHCWAPRISTHAPAMSSSSTEP
jgi:hypothetical protein